MYVKIELGDLITPALFTPAENSEVIQGGKYYDLIFPFISVEEMQRVLDELKTKGQTHLSFQPDFDHRTYYLQGATISNLTPEEEVVYTEHAAKLKEFEDRKDGLLASFRAEIRRLREEEKAYKAQKHL